MDHRWCRRRNEPIPEPGCPVLCQAPERISETWVGHHRTVEVAQHWTFFHCGLDEVVRGEGVVCRAAFKTDCDVRFYYVAGNECAALANFLLRGKNADNVHIRFSFFRSFMVSRTAAQPTRLSNALPSMTPVVSLYSKVTSGTTGAPMWMLNTFSVSSLEVEPMSMTISAMVGQAFCCRRTGSVPVCLQRYRIPICRHRSVPLPCEPERCSSTSRPEAGNAECRLV